jgi:hypothetical protein
MVVFGTTTKIAQTPSGPKRAQSSGEKKLQVTSSAIAELQKLLKRSVGRCLPFGNVKHVIRVNSPASPGTYDRDIGENEPLCSATHLTAQRWPASRF